MNGQTEISEDNLKTVKFLAEFAVKPMFRTPVHKTPADHGITEWEDILFPSPLLVPRIWCNTCSFSSRDSAFSVSVVDGVVQVLAVVVVILTSSCIASQGGK